MTITQFWNQDCLQLSSKWTLCQNKLDSASLSNSWFNINLHSFEYGPSTSMDLRQDLLNRITERHLSPTANKPKKPKKPRKPKPKSPEDPPKKPVRKRKEPINGVLRARKIKLFPSPDQRKILKEWFGCSRFLYNRTIEMINQHRQNKTKIPSWIEYKKTNTIDPNDQLNAWQKDIPRHIRDEALHDAFQALSTNLAKVKINPKHHFTLHFKKRKTASDSIFIDRELVYLERRTVYPSFLGNDLFKAKHIKGIEKVEGDCRLVCEHGDQYYLMITTDKHIVSVDELNQTRTKPTRAELIALDPGERTFLTGFCPDRSQVVEIAPKDSARICRLCIHLDNMTSKLNDKQFLKATYPDHDKRRRHIQRFKKAMQRARNRIKNLVDEMHKKAVHFLVSNYKTIMLPEYKTSVMLKRGKSRINSKTARMMATWAHYRFRVRLENKVAETSDTKLIIVDEAYTTKTCTRCGELNQTIGGSKVFKCKQCKLVIDRDYNGSRNIALKNLTNNTNASTLRNETLPEGPMQVPSRS